MSESLTHLRQTLAALIDHPAVRQDRQTLTAIGGAQTQLDSLEAELASGSEQKRLAALYEVSRAIGSSLDLAEVLNQVMDAVIRLTGAERGFLVLLDEAGGGLDVRAARNFNRETLAPGEIELSRTFVREVARSGTPVVTTNAQNDPRLSASDSIMHFALRSIMAAPLRARGQMIGAVYVDNKVRAGKFGERDLELLTAFASQAAVAIENARLYTRTDEALDRRVAELQALQVFDRELNTGLDFDRVMQITLQWAVRGVGAASGWIGLKETGEQLVRVAAVAPASPDGGPAAGDEADPEAAEKPALRPALAGDRPVRVAAAAGGGTARLGVPILREGNPIAVVEVQRPEDFSDEEEAFLARLADHAAIAIENAQLYAAVRKANETKSQFVSVVTHELKIPMTSIKGYTDILRKGMAGPVSDTQRGMLDTVRNNVDRMSVLVSDLSDISKVETGRLRLELEEVEIGPALEETLAALRPQIEGKGQTLVVNAPPDLPCARADKSRLAQILTNLINNAHKYTPGGGTLTVAVEPTDHFLRFVVADTGIGISPEDQAKLFTQFFRSDDPQVREQTGWGLGLHITRRLIELMGGEIGVKSRAGQGSTFTFTLPLV